MIQFPKNFLWGAATSAYQVEGGNSNADWWPWEAKAGKEKSGEACRHYELYEQDFDLVQSLGHNAHRLSIEWSRIEPEEGHFSAEAMTHYVNVILALRARRIEPIVTLHHFTNPVWFSESGGWENKNAPRRFLKFCDFAVRALAPHVRYWVTINEPLIYATHAYLFGLWPPQGTSIRRLLQVKDRLLEAHIGAYRLIHRIHADMHQVKPEVSIAKHLSAFVPCDQSLKNRLAAFLRHRWFNMDFIERAARARTLDYIGVNYYSRQLVDLKRWGIRNLAEDVCQKNHDPVKKNSLGWDIYPAGLEQLLMKLKKYNLPVMIAENGICTEDDSLRLEFLREHLKSIHRAMEQGVRVNGYLYWSLMDNFEWAYGFQPHFGLIQIDYKTQARTIRPSALQYAEICRTGKLI